MEKLYHLLASSERVHLSVMEKFFIDIIQLTENQ